MQGWPERQSLTWHEHPRPIARRSAASAASMSSESTMAMVPGGSSLSGEATWGREMLIRGMISQLRLSLNK